VGRTGFQAGISQYVHKYWRGMVWLPLTVEDILLCRHTAQELASSFPKNLHLLPGSERSVT